MRFSINTNEFGGILEEAARCTSVSAELPVLSTVKVEAKGEGVVIEATDLSRSARFTAPALVEEEGACCLPAQRLAAAAKYFDAGAVTVETEGGAAKVACGDSIVDLPVMDAEDFPGFPDVAPEASVEMRGDDLKAAVGLTAYATVNPNKPGMMPILTGIHLSAADGKIVLTATDSYRVVQAETECGEGVIDAVADSRWLSMVAGNLADEASIVIGKSENQVIVDADGVRYIARAVEGKYPDTDRFFNQLKRNTVVRFDPALLVRKIGFAVAASGTKDGPVKLSVGKDGVQVSMKSFESGSATAPVAAEVEGPEVDICVKASFLADAIKRVEGAGEVTLSIEGPVRPAMFEADPVRPYRAIVMPMRG